MTDDVIERCAQAAYEATMTMRKHGHLPFEPWEKLPEYWKRIYRVQVRAMTAAHPQLSGDPVCDCGHPPVDHHGTDRGESGGCFGEGRGLLDPERCVCRRTCSDVRAAYAEQPNDWAGHPDTPVSESELQALITADYSGGKLAWR